MEESVLKVAIIDDDAQQLDMYSRWLRLHDIEVLPVKSAIGSVTNTVVAFQPHVVLVDLEMPHMPGADLIKLLRRRMPRAYYVVFSAACAERLRKMKSESGADEALSKSTPFKMFVAMVKTFEDAWKKGDRV